MAAIAAIMWASGGAVADTAQDCNQDADRELAIRACSELIGRNPSNANAIFNRGLSHNNTDRHEAAIGDLRNDPDGCNDLGNAYLRLKRHGEAVKEYQRAVAVDPRYARGHNRALGIDPA